MSDIYWTCFYKKEYKSFYFDTFGGPTDKHLLNQPPGPISFHNIKFPVLKSRSSGTFCLYFFCLIER